MMNAMGIGDVIRRLRIERGWTQAELAERLGIEPATVSGYERGTRTPDAKMLKKIAEAFGVHPGVLFEDEEVTPTKLPPTVKEIPLFDTDVSAGNGCFPEAFQPVEFIPVDRKDVDYAFTVHGRSMEPELMEGDIVIVKAVPINEVRDGEIVVAIYDNRFFIKRIHFVDSQVVLLSDNDEYAPIIIDPKERFEVIGKVVEIRRIPKRKRFRRG